MKIKSQEYLGDYLDNEIAWRKRELSNYRNSVAHGEHQELDKAEYLVLHEEVRKMMDHFKTDIQNAALMARFQKKI